ncbi:MAG: hypothetical protein R6V08_09375 [Desulfuromonadales bacterium]
MAGADTPPGSSGLLIEDYPHTALLALMQVDRRVKYKVRKRSKYWPGLPPQQHRDNLVQKHSAILNALGKYIESIPLILPEPETVPFKLLKRFEDGIDALI